jgi:UDP-N-acetylmuramoyl-L-alanyl-D-glutamate--2,6-diaminopimelate ligase
MTATDHFAGDQSSGVQMDVDISGLTADSRRVEPGFLFAALPSASPEAAVDGCDFIEDAIDRGAVAILAPNGTELPSGVDPANIQFLTDSNPRARLAEFAANFFGPQPKWITAVTGTNGKSSVVDMARQIWQVLGYKTASIGTLGIQASAGEIASPGLTTLDPVALHQALSTLAQQGTTHVALEASSHGLDQSRLDGVDIKAAAFTVFGRDHMDYHGGADAYFAAKARLFETLLPTGGTAILNADIPEFRELTRICRARGHRIVSYGSAGSDLRLLDAQPLPDGQAVEIEVDDKPYAFHLPLYGTFQAHNMLAALGLVLANGADRAGSLSALTRLKGVPGRMEEVARHPNGAGIFVDYAHTHDALSAALSALRPHCKGRLAIVFGAGGDRDRGKRPLMGEVAATHADILYVTDDNPRTEEPSEIRAEILQSCPRAREIGDREVAIRTAISALEEDDILLIAGKGHETGQVIGAKTVEFSDAAVSRNIVAGIAAEIREKA